MFMSLSFYVSFVFLCVLFIAVSGLVSLWHAEPVLLHFFVLFLVLLLFCVIEVVPVLNMEFIYRKSPALMLPSSL
jgi:hypothetical protein